GHRPGSARDWAPAPRTGRWSLGSARNSPPTVHSTSRPPPRAPDRGRAPLESPRVTPSTPAPPFLTTIDPEGDDLWGRPRRVTTQNASYLERFQLLCEEQGLKPTWLTNHEMVSSPVYRTFAEDVLARGTGEIGMHLHAWDSPPLTP